MLSADSPIQPLSLYPPMAYILPFTAAKPRWLLACCIGALCTQVFSAAIDVEENGVAKNQAQLCHQECRKQQTSAFVHCFLLLESFGKY
jgi:hypothetical protein